MLKFELPLLPLRYRNALLKLTPNFKKLYEDGVVISIVMIGSCAKGCQRMFSDIDFVIYVEDDIEIGLDTSADYETILYRV